LSEGIVIQSEPKQSILDLLGIVFGIALAGLSIYLIVDKNLFLGFVHRADDVLLFGVLTFLGLLSSIILIIKSIPVVNNDYFGEQVPF